MRYQMIYELGGRVGKGARRGYALLDCNELLSFEGSWLLLCISVVLKRLPDPRCLIIWFDLPKETVYVLTLLTALSTWPYGTVLLHIDATGQFCSFHIQGIMPCAYLETILYFYLKERRQFITFCILLENRVLRQSRMEPFMVLEGTTLWTFVGSCAHYSVSQNKGSPNKKKY